MVGSALLSDVMSKLLLLQSEVESSVEDTAAAAGSDGAVAAAGAGTESSDAVRAVQGTADGSESSAWKQ